MNKPAPNATCPRCRGPASVAFTEIYCVAECDTKAQPSGTAHDDSYSFTIPVSARATPPRGVSPGKYGYCKFCGHVVVVHNAIGHVCTTCGYPATVSSP